MDSKNEVIDAEVVDEGPSSRSGSSQSSGFGRQSGFGQGSGFGQSSGFGSSGRPTPTSRNREENYTFFRMASTSAPGHQGFQQASVITFALLFFCLFHWGFLAALGFAFFYLLGSAVGIYVTMRKVLQGSLPNPWLIRICVWAVSMLLVSSMVH